MTALDRARGWFIAPPDAPGDEPAWCALSPPAPAESERATPPARDGGVLHGSRTAGAHEHTPRAKSSRGGWQPPVADELVASPRVVTSPAAPGRPTETEPVPAGFALPRVVTAAVDAAPDDAGVASSRVVTAAVDAAPTTVEVASPRVVTSAAVLGRAGEVEPVAAALALALRREARAATAAVAVIGAALPDVAEGGGAARRLAARLEGQGFEARVRGRLAWVRLDPEDSQLAVVARRLTFVAAPAVLAVTAPRNAGTDAALVECDLLVIVAADPDGPLARLAASGLSGPAVVTVRPLGRGPGRALARAGVRSARPVRHLLSNAQEQRP